MAVGLMGIGIWGWWLGYTKSVDGAAIIAPGYDTRWIYGLRSPRESTVELLKLTLEFTERELRELTSLRAQKNLLGSDRDRWSLGGNDPIFVEFSATDRQVVQLFLEDGLRESGRSDCKNPSDP